MTSRRSRVAFRPCLDALPSRIAPTNYPPIDVPADPMHTGTSTWSQPIPVIVTPGSPEAGSSLIQAQLQLNAAMSD